MRYGLATASDYVNTASPCRISEPFWLQRVKVWKVFNAVLVMQSPVDFQARCWDS